MTGEGTGLSSSGGGGQRLSESIVCVGVHMLTGFEEVIEIHCRPVHHLVQSLQFDQVEHLM